MRFLLEKATNFSDIRRVVCFNEALKLDTAIDCKKFQKEPETLLTDSAQWKSKSLWEDHTGTMVDQSQFDLGSGKTDSDNLNKYTRCTLYTLATFLLQNKKNFRMSV